METKLDPYGTHIPITNEILKAIPRTTPCAILEFGCGLFSTPIFRKHIESNPACTLISIESNVAWLDKVREMYPESPQHTYLDPATFGSWSHAIDHVLNVLIRDSKLWLSFIDSSPWDSRTIALFKLKEISELVLVHDCDYFPDTGLWGRRLTASDPKDGGANHPRRDYGDVFKHWCEYMPTEMASPTGPPTLVGSHFQPITFAPIDTVVSSSSMPGST